MTRSADYFSLNPQTLYAVLSYKFPTTKTAKRVSSAGVLRTIIIVVMSTSTTSGGRRASVDKRRISTKIALVFDVVVVVVSVGRAISLRAEKFFVGREIRRFLKRRTRHSTKTRKLRFSRTPRATTHEHRCTPLLPRRQHIFRQSNYLTHCKVPIVKTVRSLTKRIAVKTIFSSALCLRGRESGPVRTVWAVIIRKARNILRNSKRYCKTQLYGLITFFFFCCV